MTCPYETGECEWPQDCEDCNPDLYTESKEVEAYDCVCGKCAPTTILLKLCGCQEVEAEPVTVEELKDRMSQDLDYMDSKTRAEIKNALYWIGIFQED